MVAGPVSSPAALLTAFLTCACVLFGSMAVPGPARAQNPLLDAIESASEPDAPRPDRQDTDAADDPLLSIEDALAEARQRQIALENARTDETGDDLGFQVIVRYR